MRARFHLLPVVLAALLFAAPRPAFAAEAEDPAPWPAKDVRVTLPFSKGSETDILARLFEPPFAAQTGKKMTANFTPGQAGADAWARMVDDAPDGSVLTVIALPHVFLRMLQPDSGISLSSPPVLQRDVQPGSRKKPTTMAVCHVTAYTPCVLWAANPSAIASVQAFVDTARNMNGTFLVAGPGRYSAGQLAARILDRQAGIKTTYIPYEGSLEAGKAVLGRQASVFWAHSVHLPELGAMAKPLAVAAEKRLTAMPDVPTFRELGLEVVMGMHIGFAVPMDTPEETQKGIAAFLARYATNPAFKTRAESLGFTPLDITLETMPAFLQKETTAVSVAAEEYDIKNQ